MSTPTPPPGRARVRIIHIVIAASLTPNFSRVVDKVCVEPDVDVRAIRRNSACGYTDNLVSICDDRSINHLYMCINPSTRARCRPVRGATNGR